MNNENLLVKFHEKIQNSIVTTYRSIFPGDTNHHNTLFGGNVMSYMDEVAFITATKFSKKPLVTVASKNINFLHPIPSGTIIKVTGVVCRIGKSSVDIYVNTWVESMYNEVENFEAVTGTITLVAVDKNNNSIPII